MKDTIIENFTKILHDNGLKSTPLRLGILDILTRSKKPLSSEELQLKLSKIEHDKATLFRCLKKFTQVDLVQMVDLGEGFLRYEMTCHEHHHHHHVMCVKCKKIEVLPFCIPKSVETHLKTAGYTNLTHRMDFFGLCKKCS
jgi:Fur family transcriptional regulator, ferric uptake regulator